MIGSSAASLHCEAVLLLLPMAAVHDDGFDPEFVEQYSAMFFEGEELEEEVHERETDKLSRRLDPEGDEWDLRAPGDTDVAEALFSWEVGLAVACGTHRRLGSDSPLCSLGGDTDLLIEVLRRVPIIVPDHCTTLKQAISIAFPGQHILIRKGEHNVAANPGDEAVTEGGRGVGHTVLDIHKSVHLIGEEGTVLRGMLVFKEGAREASVRNMTVQDAGQSCLLCESGTWSLESCFLMCGHASAIKAIGHAQVSVRRSRIGGEGEIGQAVSSDYELPCQWIDTAGSVQEYGLRKHACYGVFVKDSASVVARECDLSFCSESAVFLRDFGCVQLERCHLRENAVGFTAGTGGGRYSVYLLY